MARSQFEKEGKLITVPILDRIGQEIAPGCIIAYGHALGRCAGLRLGKVVKIVGIIKTGYRPNDPNGNETREYRITIHGLDDDSFDINQPDRIDYSGRRWADEVKLLDKKSTLMFPSRTVVVDPERLPQKFQDLFETVEI